MGILDRFRPARYADPTLGTLVRRGRYWRGQISLGAGPAVPLLLTGGRSAPDESIARLARELVARYATLRHAIERALFEHYEPFAHVVEPGDAEEVSDGPRLTRAEHVWDHVVAVRVLIEPMTKIDTVEIAYRTDWDVEHTVGARFQEWVLVELNGSVI